MCLAVPMKIIALADEDTGTADLGGVSCSVNLSLVENPAVGDFVIVHAGFAIEKLNQEEADERISMFEQLSLLQGTEKA